MPAQLSGQRTLLQRHHMFRQQHQDHGLSIKSLYRAVTASHQEVQESVLELLHPVQLLAHQQ
jgi:hypothetical protein